MAIGLSTPSTSYYYRSYIKIDDSIVYGTTQTFMILQLSPVVPSGYENRSKSYGVDCGIHRKLYKTHVPKDGLFLTEDLPVSGLGRLVRQGIL